MNPFAPRRHVRGHRDHHPDVFLARVPLLVTAEAEVEDADSCEEEMSTVAAEALDLDLQSAVEDVSRPVVGHRATADILRVRGPDHARIHVLPEAIRPTVAAAGAAPTVVVEEVIAAMILGIAEAGRVHRCGISCVCDLQMDIFILFAFCMIFPVPLCNYSSKYILVLLLRLELELKRPLTDRVIT